MSVSEEAFASRLQSLHEVAEDAGIELSFDGCPIERVSWEFEIDATGAAIDWFEVRPEIRWKGENVPREVWERALAGKGIVARGGAIQFLDAASMRSLALVASLLGGTQKKAGRRQVASIPRLRIIELLALRKEGIPVRLTDEDEAIVARLTRFTGIGERPAPALRAELRQYQREGYHWLAFLYENGFGACLADDMGLGKTVQAVCLLAAIKEGKVAPRSRGHAGLKSLVVVPSSLIFNWEREIERFYPGLAVRVYRGRRTRTGQDDYDVLISSYGLVRRHIGKLKQTAFGIIIFDEAQAVKNIFSDTTRAVRQLKGLFKVALTGTPVENHLGEYFSIMDLVLPGLLGDYREFQGRAKADAAAVLPMLKERTRPFVLRRTKERILKELPPKIERDVYLDLNEEQKRFYNRTVAEVRTTVAAAYRLKAAEQARIIALTAIMKLRQICLSPQLLVPELKTPAPKVEFLKEKLAELCGASHSSLVFSQFTSFLDLVEAELRSQDVPVFRLDGSTPVGRRKRIVDGFQKSGSPAVFLLSLKAGGQGLNLTRGDYVFHLDPWWNPAVESQASDRSHRIGQKKKVIVTRLLMRHTIEEKMTALKARKAGLYHALMDGPEAGADRAITREDFEFLLG
jgi:non-specific serine/threonine protein kinase